MRAISNAASAVTGRYRFSHGQDGPGIKAFRHYCAQLSVAMPDGLSTIEMGLMLETMAETGNLNDIWKALKACGLARACAPASSAPCQHPRCQRASGGHQRWQDAD